MLEQTSVNRRSKIEHRAMRNSAMGTQLSCGAEVLKGEDVPERLASLHAREHVQRARDGHGDHTRGDQPAEQ